MSPGREAPQRVNKISRSPRPVGATDFSAVVFSFCSFLLLGHTTHAPRHTPGCLAPCLFRPVDKILSSWRHTRVRQLFIGSALGRETADRPCVMGFSCERDSPSERRPWVGRIGGRGSWVGTRQSPNPRDEFYLFYASRRRCSLGASANLSRHTMQLSTCAPQKKITNMNILL